MRPGSDRDPLPRGEKQWYGRKPESRSSEHVFNAESFTGATVSGPAMNADPGRIFISLQENSFPLMQSPDGIQAPAPVLNAETNRSDTQATAPLESSTHLRRE